MYTPSHFQEIRASALRALMRRYPLAALVTQSPVGMDANHIPLLSLESGRLGLLQGHVARANPLWQDVGSGSEVLAIFQGPNHYVPPRWYPSKEKHGKVVPTWNYLVVHVRGKIEWQHDPVWLRRHLEAATSTYESGAEPWRISDAPAGFVERLLTAIVGFEIPISSIEGKWKLGQNRGPEDRRGVIEGLKGRCDAAAAEMLEWMEDDDGSST